jgi:hypothetical protein
MHIEFTENNDDYDKSYKTAVIGLKQNAAVICVTHFNDSFYAAMGGGCTDFSGG